MKKILLIIALLLPIGVFVFLRFFGKNEFSIPVYYESLSDIPTNSCDRKYEEPYLVSDSVLIDMGWKGSVSLIISDTSQDISLGLKRLNEEFDQNIQSIYPQVENPHWEEIYACDFFLKKPWSALLLDDQRRIRGYYDLNSREEIDRLIVELKILLKQY